MGTYILSAGKYFSPYVKKFWSKRLYYVRPTYSVRSMLRGHRQRKLVRRFSFMLKDLATFRLKRLRYLQRVNYANR